ncbi:hypothetical protein FACS1894201_05640 [Bacteroidia bacterium]|nr:hypothetical protein FACS1894201_05640 [Bacteroidia bacterium]
MSEQKDKVLRIKTENPQQYHIDQVVTVVMRTSLGLKAVLWAYVLPFIVLMASLFAGALLLHNELYGALIALGGTALYYVVLSLFREKLDRKMTAEIQVV